MTTSSPLKGYLILLVEDDPLIGLDIALTLEDAGARILGPCGNAKVTLEAIENLGPSDPLHGAVLDVDLGDHTSEEVARKLMALEIPFVFHSGNNAIGGDAIIGIEATVIPKPCIPSVLVSGVADCIQHVPHR